MKAFKTIATVTLALYATVVLSACGKTSNGGSTAASTPAPSCSLQPDGSYRNSSGAYCTSGSFVCPASGYYTGANGNRQCTPGQTVNVNDNYPYPTNPNTGCDYWSQFYGQLYVPMMLNGQYVCANYQWLNSQVVGTPYYNNYDYYYNYPPYSQGNGNCDKSIFLSYNNFAGGVCF